MWLREFRIPGQGFSFKMRPIKIGSNRSDPKIANRTRNLNKTRHQKNSIPPDQNPKDPKNQKQKNSKQNQEKENKTENTNNNQEEEKEHIKKKKTHNK